MLASLFARPSAGPACMSTTQRLACLLAFVAVAGCGGTPEPPHDLGPLGWSEVETRLAERIQEELDRGVASVSIAVVDDTRLAWAQGFGLAHPERGTPASADTLYEAGSVAKLFTAIAVMQLVETGLVDLDAPLSTYLPEFHVEPPLLADEGWSVERITVRSLLTHHSGLPGDLLWPAAASPSGQPPYRRLPERLRSEHAATPPGFVHAYSNLGFGLLGLLVERVSGRDFASHVRERVLVPAGMAQASFSPDAAAALAVGDNEGEAQGPSVGAVEPEGSLVASARELGAFLRSILAHAAGAEATLLERETLLEMWRRQNGQVALDLDLAVGLSWGLSEHPDAGRIVGHDGATFQQRAELWLSPEQRVGVALLSNSLEADLSDIAHEALGLAARARTGAPASNAEPRAAGLQIGTPILAELVGPYDTALGIAFFEAQRGSLRAGEFPVWLEMRPTPQGTFRLFESWLGLLHRQPAALSELELSFDRIGDHEVLVAWSRGRRSLAGTRLVRPRVPDRWRERTGTYRSHAAEGDLIVERIELELEEGFLVSRIELGVGDVSLEMALAPVDAQRAVVLGVGRNRGDVVHFDDRGGETLLRFWGAEFVRER